MAAKPTKTNGTTKPKRAPGSAAPDEPLDPEAQFEDETDEAQPEDELDPGDEAPAAENGERPEDETPPPKRPVKVPGQRTAEFEATLKRYKGKPLLVLLKGTPDPDSIASAWALKYMAAAFGVDVTILYTDKLSHQENRALVKSMEIPMVFYSERFDFTPFQGYCIVDSPQTDFTIPNLEGLPKLPLVILVDHHKSDGSTTAEFIDIRENAGSTASIFGEYLREGSVGLVPGNQECLQIATALMHGIRSDTDGYFLAREIDFLSSSYLSIYDDSDLLKIISAQLIPPKTMDILYKALQSKAIRENYLMSGVGFVREEDRDGIPQAADYLLRREGIDTVIVYGIVDERFIEGSLRTRSRVLDPDQFLKGILGQDSEGKPYGGGRLDKGGFKIPVGMFANCGDKTLLWEMTTRTMSEIFCKALGIAAPEFKQLEYKLPKKDAD